MLDRSYFDSVDEVQLYILDKLFSEGDSIITRELKTLELCNINFCLTNPRNRNTYNSKRNWKKALAIGEFAWHVSGSKSVDFITYYARNWKDFSSDGKEINQSCYGHKIFNKESSIDSQWERIIKLLKEDEFSRRAVLNLYDSDEGIDGSVKDVSCVCNVQFLIRKEKLDVIVNMRSNDIIWGLPYDIYLFTMFQELLSLEIGVELGRYYHNVGSMHIYERHFSLGNEMLGEQLPQIYVEPPMDDIRSLKAFLRCEEGIRTETISVEEILSLPISEYWKSLLKILWQYKIRKKSKIDSQLQKKAEQHIT